MESTRVASASIADGSGAFGWKAGSSYDCDITHPSRVRRPRRATLGRLLLAAVDRHRGTAMSVPRDGAFHETTFAELGRAAREIAAGLIDDRRAPGRSRRDPRQHAPGVDARRLRRAVRRRHRRPDLPHELRRGMPLRARAFRGRRCSSARTRRRRGRSPRSATSCRRSAHVYTMLPVDGLPSLDDLRAAARACPTTPSPMPSHRCRRTTRPRSSTRPGPPARPRAACSRTPTSCRDDAYVRGVARATSSCPAWSSSCSCRSRTRSPASSSWSRSTPVRRCRSGAATRSACSTTWPRRGRSTSLRCRGCSRRSTPARSRPPKTPRRCGGAIFEWAIATGARARAAERRGRTPAPLLRAGRQRRRPAGPRRACATSSAASCASDSPARRRSAARCSSSSTPAAS